MKKYILTAITLCFSLLCMAQTQSTDPTRMKVVKTNGEEIIYEFTDIDYIEFIGEETPDEPEVAPKIGDYYYSDGTWSDGGLISINSDGTSPVWASPRPAPLNNKTVIGIVFTTDQSRMSAEDIAAGYTHGYVIACKNITDPAHSFTETVWYSRLDAVDDIATAKIAKTWYNTLNGRQTTAEVFEKHPEDPATEFPMFHYGSIEFKCEAPASSSGWFIPSTGQLWDAIANLSGNEAATAMKSYQTIGYDATYYCSEKVSGNPLAEFLKAFEQIPEADREPLSLDKDNNSGHYVSLRTSTMYEEDSTCIFNLGSDGLVECMAAWLNEDCHARPILAF